MAQLRATAARSSNAASFCRREHPVAFGQGVRVSHPSPCHRRETHLCAQVQRAGRRTGGRQTAAPPDRSIRHAALEAVRACKPNPPTRPAGAVNDLLRMSKPGAQAVDTSGCSFSNSQPAPSPQATPGRVSGSAVRCHRGSRQARSSVHLLSPQCIIVRAERSTLIWKPYYLSGELRC